MWINLLGTGIVCFLVYRFLRFRGLLIDAFENSEFPELVTTFPVSEPRPEEYAQVLNRINDFINRVLTEQNAELIISSDDLNLLETKGAIRPSRTMVRVHYEIGSSEILERTVVFPYVGAIFSFERFDHEYIESITFQTGNSDSYPVEVRRRVMWNSKNIPVTKQKDYKISKRKLLALVFLTGRMTTEESQRAYDAFKKVNLVEIRNGNLVIGVVDNPA